MAMRTPNIGVSHAAFRQLPELVGILAVTLLAIAAKNMRMGGSGNDVNNIFMFGQNLRQSLDNVFNSLIRREQTEGEQYCFSFHAKLIFVKVRI